MQRFRRALALAAAALVATVAAVVVPATGAMAAPPLDPSMPSSWAKWTFHSGGDYNLVVDASYSGGHGAAAQLYGDHGGSNQIWFQEAAAEGGQFLHPGYDRWLCLGRNGTGWGSSVSVQACDGSANQRWLITRLRYEYYLLKPYDAQDLCVDVPNSNFAQGVDLQLWGCNESAAQYWRMGQCWAAACDGQWPDVTDCDTSGGDEVLDVTRGSERLVLIRATGCHAFYARLTYQAGTGDTIKLVMRRHHTDGNSSAMVLPVEAGQTRWSPMFGVDQTGATFDACVEKYGDPSYTFCTNLWWV
ncbi:RICIN domain-containing protein [Plantactinospora sp. B5E13]|uniref:RICIN domain-containing protein n=1 Tax=unclassified Plantactinospora TaxID=2631981 RepID=UPI00325C3800